MPRLVELGGAVLGAAIVPKDGVAHSPPMTIDEVGSGSGLLKIPDQVTPLGLRQSLDLAGPPTDVGAATDGIVRELSFLADVRVDDGQR